MPYKDKEKSKEYQKGYRLEHKEKNKEYNKEYNKKYGLEHKEEKKEYSKKYYLEHKDESKKYYLEHKEEKKEYKKECRLEHKEEIKEKNKKYRLEHIDKIRSQKRKCHRNRLVNDPIYKRVRFTRNKYVNIIAKIIKNGDISAGNDADCLKLFGTTVDGYKRHIESQFTDTMSWYNNGQINNPNKWQLDHIIPIGSFDFTIEENFTRAFHYTNTQPLMSSDHLEKSSKEKYDK